MDLFTPGKIGTLALPNRLVRSATAERMASLEGEVTPALISFLTELAAGGVGLIITGHMYVHPSGRCDPEMTAVCDDRFIPGLKDLAEAVHSKGVRVVVQINHGGMQSNPKVVPELVAPSDVASGLVAKPVREITEKEILGLIDAYGQAARRVKEAGFDGVQIHAAHGYLINQFLSPLVNKREDRWGGNLKKRMQFLRDVASGVRAEVGPEYPVLIKLGLRDDKEGGLSLEEGLIVVAGLEEMGIDGGEVSCGIGTSSIPGIKVGVNEGYFIPLAERARKVTVLPLILVGGFRSRKFMEKTLTDGTADFISLSRPFLCESDLPAKMKAGLQDCSICISGNNCRPKSTGEGIRCKCNIVP